MPPLRDDTRPTLTGRRLWRHLRASFVSGIAIMVTGNVILRIEAIPLPLRFAAVVAASAAIAALVGWWSYRTGDEIDREHFVGEWRWLRRLWRRAGLRRP